MTCFNKEVNYLLIVKILVGSEKRKWKSLNPVWLFATPWTVALQAPLSIRFSRKEYCSGLPFPSPGDLPWPRDQTHVSCIGRLILYHWATREALSWSWQQSNRNINWEQSMLYLMGDESKYPNHSLKIICTS